MNAVPLPPHKELSMTKNLLLVVVVLSVAACGQQIDGEQIATAQKACGPHNGLENVQTYYKLKGTLVVAKCKDNLAIHIMIKDK